MDPVRQGPRLYISTENGQRVGWLDLLTGDTTVKIPEFTDAFHEAISAFQRASGLSVGRHC